MNPQELEDATLKLEELVERADKDVGHGKKELLIRARNLAAALLDPYVLSHTKIVVNLVKKRGGDEIDEIAAWLHDIGRAVTDEGHRTVGAIWAEKWLKKFYITDEELERIADGIRRHGTGGEPKTKTGKMLKLVDALAVFDGGWARMFVGYFRAKGKVEVAAKMLEKKRKVVDDMGSEDERKYVEKMWGELFAD